MARAARERREQERETPLFDMKGSHLFARPLTVLAAGDGPCRSVSSPLLQSLRAQTSGQWRLALIGGAAPDAAEQRIGLYQSARAAAESAADGLIAIADTGTRLHPSAIGAFLAAFAEHPDAVAAYADGTEAVQGRRRPELRPAWNPDLLRSTRYTGDPFVVTTAALRAAMSAGWNPGLEEVRRHDLALRVGEHGGEVLHIRAALAHRDRPRTADSEAAVAAVQAHLDRTGRLARASPGPIEGSVVCSPAFDRVPSVSIIIPTAAAPDRRGRPMVEQCLASLACTQWSDVETILVVGDECRSDIAPLAAAATPPARVVRRPAGPFNYSTAVNCGALAARGDLLVLLNDDTEVRDPSWLTHMAVHATDSEVGAVGARLLYADATIQHVGVAFAEARPMHPFVRRTADEAALEGWGVARTVSAVTAACLMTRRREFLAVGGMSATLPLSFNDVDFCLRLARAGRRSVIEPAATLIHHESMTRQPGAELWEWHRFVCRWGEVVDPWYDPSHFPAPDAADTGRDLDRALPAEPPMNLEPRVARIEPHAYRDYWNLLCGLHLEPQPATGPRGRGRPTAGSVAPVTPPGISVETVPDGEDPIESDEPAVLRGEILRLRDGLSAAGAVSTLNTALAARVAGLEHTLDRYERLLEHPALRALVVLTRPFRRWWGQRSGRRSRP